MKKARWWKSFVPVVVNLLLGIPAVVPAVACFGGIWALTNLWIRRKLFTEGPPSMYWPVSVVLVLGPYFLGAGFA
ncbi:hypothetical protein [Streptomyces cyaneofuscatus]|uniref:hypothetical protein n=1 Tax=Streptomyces cyaneofuscatus TaxID=66883 RepID=UPI0036D92F31